MEKDDLPQVVVHGFSVPTRHFLESLVGKRVKLEMMNGGGGDKDVSPRMRGVLVDVYDDGILLDRDDKARTLVFVSAIRAINEEAEKSNLTAQSVPMAQRGAKLF